MKLTPPCDLGFEPQQLCASTATATAPRPEKLCHPAWPRHHHHDNRPAAQDRHPVQRRWPSTVAPVVCCREDGEDHTAVIQLGSDVCRIRPDVRRRISPLHGCLFSR
ncbi:hypothetical protein PG987_011238 [Apiospora arundinis]